MVDADPCSSCIEQGKCGRCGASDPAWADDPFVCTSCGWKSDEGEGAPGDDYCCMGECKPENIEEARRLDREATEWRASQ